VALALIPEALAFSIIAGVDPKVGLYAAFIIAVVSAIAGGRPGMISAATGAIALLVVSLVKDHGVEYLFAAGILAGILQIAAGYLKLGALMRFVSRSVITGFVNALAILIFLAQLPELRHGGTMVYVLVGAGLAIIYLLPRVTQTCSLSLGVHCGSDGYCCLHGLACAHGRRHGRFPGQPPNVPCPQHSMEPRHAENHLAIFIGNCCSGPA